VKNTKNIECLKLAIKAQDLDVEYYINEARSLIRELRSSRADRHYCYEKIRHLNDLMEY
jgi:hypothetical protein